MADAKTCHTLTSYFAQQYKLKFGTSPVLNRNKARWGFDSILYDLDIEETKQLIDFYLQTINKTYELEWFFFNYDKLIELQENKVQDDAHRAKLREESKTRAKEWRAKIDEQRT